MDNPDKLFRIGHRQRLRQKFIDGQLAEYELLELVLSFVIPRRDVRPLAHGLIAKFGSIYQILTAPLPDLINYPGIGQNTAVFLKAIAQLMISGCKFQLTDQPVFRDEKAFRNYCVLTLSGKANEELHVMYLDSTLRLLADDLHSIGTSDWSPVYPREILKRALDLSARSVVLLHNHPTPGLCFSDADIDITKEVAALLTSCGIELYDHYLVSGGVLYSARNLFLLK